LCHGKHAANDRSYPRYKQEEQVLKIKSSRNVSYAEAVKMHRNSAQGLSSSNMSSRSEFPPTVDRSPRNLCPNLSNTNAVDSTGEEIIVTEEVGSFNMFHNPIHFLAFLAEVISELHHSAPKPPALQRQRWWATDLHQNIPRVLRS